MNGTQLQNSRRFYSNRGSYRHRQGRPETAVPVEANNSQRRENSEVLAAIKLLS
jgi:hypothetical protein